MLVQECKQKGLYNEPWTQFVGILQDEIKIKSDLVYCPTSGELVGYVRLDDLSDQLRKLQCHIRKMTWYGGRVKVRSIIRFDN